MNRPVMHAFLATVVVSMACKSDSPSSLDGGAQSDEGGDCSSLSYDNFGEAFVAEYCLYCHSASLTGAARGGATPGQNFDTLADIQTHQARMRDLVARELMPYPPTASRFPTHERRTKFVHWLDCGAP
jgi:uncharacterized membrane protein